MARLLRVQYPGAIYHVTLRGNARQAIFVDQRDRETFVARLADSVELHGIRLYLFTLMTNHVHLLCETPKGNLSSFMHQLQTGHSVFFNLRHGRTGHLVQGRYGSRVVEGDDYLLRLSRYLHLNPVYTRTMRKRSVKDRIEALRRYPWSSYQGYVGLSKPVDFVAYGPMLALVGVKQRAQRREYRRFVETGIAETDEELVEAMKASRLSVGSEEFRRRVWDMHIDLLSKHKRREDVAFRRMEKTLPAEDVLEVVTEELDGQDLSRRRKDSFGRAIAARMLCTYSGLSQREIGARLKWGTGAAVSMQMKKLRTAMARNRTLQNQVEGIEKRLRKMQKAND